MSGAQIGFILCGVLLLLLAIAGVIVMLSRRRQRRVPPVGGMPAPPPAAGPYDEFGVGKPRPAGSRQYPQHPMQPGTEIRP